VLGERSANRSGGVAAVERVRGHVQDLEVVEPRGVDCSQHRARASTREHHPFSRRVDENDDRPGGPADLQPDVDAALSQLLGEDPPAEVVTDAADEASRVARCGERGDVGGRATALRPDLRTRVGRGANRLEKPDDDVLDDVTDHADHCASPDRAVERPRWHVVPIRPSSPMTRLTRGPPDVTADSYDEEEDHRPYSARGES
jgi:hypothetical protein